MSLHTLESLSRDSCSVAFSGDIVSDRPGPADTNHLFLKRRIRDNEHIVVELALITVLKNIIKKHAANVNVAQIRSIAMAGVPAL